jgi:putative aldouronate transport system substrate-binding protein
MKKFPKVLSLVLAVAMVLAMVSTAGAESALSYADGTVLRMATGYNNAKTGLVFDAEVAGEGITLADGKTYNTGDLKPTWVAIEETLKIKFESIYQGNNASAEFDYWKEQMDKVDVLSGTAAKLSEAGEAGLVVNIAEYLDQMPNFKAYLEENPIVRLSITGNTDTGAIYFSPYFDGVNDIERMPLMRIDWVKKLLDGEGEFAADACKDLAPYAYQPYMPLEGKIEIETPNLEGTAVETVTKDYDAFGNIIAKMNEAPLNGVAAVNMLREYIDKTYGGYYGTDRSNLFIGQNAAWDADELVALLRCVVANPQTLNGTDTVQGLFSREDANNQRRVDLFRFAGHLFGVRGLESRQDYLYVDVNNELKDARQEEVTYIAMAAMNDIAKEGLISEAFVNGEDVKTKNYLENDLGFMHYDYNQTQTLYNETVLQDGEAYEAVMVPVARWQDGTEGGKYMRFTESWRSVKTDGWGISKAGVGDDTDKLNAALALIDYAYSPAGIIRMSYGPDAFIKTNADGSYVTFNFNGEEMPEIADATRTELWEKADGNYTNYARQFLGSTLSFMKSQAFEFQCTCDAGKEGAGKISKAIALGTIKHPELALAENPWYTSVPTVLPTTKSENDELGGFTDLNSKFQGGKDQQNLLVDIIAAGFTAEGMGSPAEAAAFVADAMNGSQYLMIKEGAWEALLDYAAELQ